MRSIESMLLPSMTSSTAAPQSNEQCLLSDKVLAEREYTQYAKADSPEWFEGFAEPTLIEQWQVFVPSNGLQQDSSMRVRQYTEPSGAVRYEHTTKVKMASDAALGYDSKKEYNIPCNLAGFELYKSISAQGQKKWRYTLSCHDGSEFDGFQWAIDRLLKADDTPTLFVKVEMEVKTKIDKRMPLPEGLTALSDDELSLIKQTLVSRHRNDEPKPS